MVVVINASRPLENRGVYDSKKHCLLNILLVLGSFFVFFLTEMMKRKKNLPQKVLMKRLMEHIQRPSVVLGVRLTHFWIFLMTQMLLCTKVDSWLGKSMQIWMGRRVSIICCHFLFHLLDFLGSNFKVSLFEIMPRAKKENVYLEEYSSSLRKPISLNKRPIVAPDLL